jgi:hypothetical protein
MTSTHVLAGLVTAAFASLAVAQSSVFDLSGTLTITGNGAPYTSDAVSGTLDINTVTGAVTGADVVFGSPAPSIPSVPPLTVIGPETAPGPAGSHFYEIELCAQLTPLTPTKCTGNWLIELGLDVTPMVPSLVGYTGGKIANMGLFYGGVQDTWGGCPETDVLSNCGRITLAQTTSPPPKGVPEPASGLLMLLGIFGTTLMRRRRPG